MCVCVCVGWGTTPTLSNSACGEAATPEALPVQAAETGRCWKAPCWEPPEASVGSGSKDKSEDAISFLGSLFETIYTVTY